MNGQYNFTIQQGATFNRVIAFKDSAGDPVSLVGYVARMQLRKEFSSTEPALSLTEGDGLTTNGAAGTVTIDIDYERTRDVPAWDYYYDLELFNADENIVHRYLQGVVTISPEATR